MNKNLVTPASVTALLTIALVFVLVQFWGTPLKELMNKFFALAIYGLLIASYLLRIVLVFFGVFGLYRILMEHVNGQDYKQVEVKIGLK